MQATSDTQIAMTSRGVLCMSGAVRTWMRQLRWIRRAADTILGTSSAFEAIPRDPTGAPGSTATSCRRYVRPHVPGVARLLGSCHGSDVDAVGHGSCGCCSSWYSHTFWFS